MMDTLSQGRVFLGTVRDFLDEEKEFFRMQGSLSIAYVPIFTGAGWWGFLGVEHCDREWEWSPGEVEGLKAIAGVLGLLLDAGGGHDMSRAMGEDDDDDDNDDDGYEEEGRKNDGQWEKGKDGEDRKKGKDGEDRKKGKDGEDRKKGKDGENEKSEKVEKGREEEGNDVNGEDITP